MRRDEDILCCDVGSERYAFRSRDVHHVERAEHLRVEATRDGRVGALPLGDRMVPVFALADVLSRRVARPVKNGGGHVAVTGDHDALVGWLVDRMVRAEQPGPGNVARLPGIVGAPATSWFDGIVRLNDGSAALLLAPHCLNPAAPVPARPTPAEAVYQPTVVTSPEPVAVVFSTTVLPATAARRFALSGRQIIAIAQPDPPMVVPGCAAHVSGVTWWRGAIVPVIDFRERADRRHDTHRRRLIARCGPHHRGALVAFSIDAEMLMCRPEDGHRQRHDLPCPSFASGIFDIDGEPVALLDLDVLLDQNRLGLRNGDAVLPDLLVERAARDAEPLCRPLDPPAFGL